MSYVELKGISKSYVTKKNERAVAVRSVDLSVDEKSLMVVLGPSGCGKSTLLRIIAGLESPDEGRVMLAGRDITDVPPQDRNIAMVFQDYALYPHMTGEKNLTSGPTLRDVYTGEAKKKAEWAASILGIEGLMRRKPGALSGGEKQRVALGRAIVKDPSIFLMDEPLSNVDALLRGKMRAEIAGIMREVGGTLIYVTHDQTEAMTIGDILSVMKDGDILQVGTPKEIYETPSSLFVAGFVGSPQMNFIRPGSKLHEKVADGLLKKVRKTIEKDLLGSAVFGIRPEDIGIGRGELKGRVNLVEELGYESHVTVESEKQFFTIRTAERPPALNKKISFALDLAKIHIFKETGERI
jgi:multiple sugar transport system ATP-binding protein